MKRGVLRFAFSSGTNFFRKKWLYQGFLFATALLACIGHGALAKDSVGLYNPNKKTFYLKNEISSGPADRSFLFQRTKKGSFPILGDWDGDGDKTIGVYNPRNRTFYLRNENTRGPAEVRFRFPNAKRTWKPLAGDWDGDGVDTVGLYDPQNRVFHLFNANNWNPDGHQEFWLENIGKGGRPIAGDWDGDGHDTIGLYDERRGTFYLWLENRTEGPTQSLAIAKVPKRSWPLVGDWNGDGMETIGLYHPRKKTFYLRNSNDTGPADHRFSIKGAKQIWRPLSWNDANGNATDTATNPPDDDVIGDPGGGPIINPVIYQVMFQGSVSMGESRWYEIETPASTVGIEARLSGLTGDADLMVYRSSSGSSGPMACISQTAGTADKVCTVADPGAKAWTIEVYGRHAADFSLTVKVFGKVRGG